MNIRPLTEQLYICPQLTEANIADAVKLGIRTVICNRPDQEEPDQPDFATVQQQLEQAGIRHNLFQPVTAPTINTADATHFADLLAQAEQPVLAFCRTGTRSTLLWGYGQAKQGRPVAEIIAVAAAAGIDLSSAEARLQAEQP